MRPWRPAACDPGTYGGGKPCRRRTPKRPHDGFLADPESGTNGYTRTVIEFPGVHLTIEYLKSLFSLWTAEDGLTQTLQSPAGKPPVSSLSSTTYAAIAWDEDPVLFAQKLARRDPVAALQYAVALGAYLGQGKGRFEAWAKESAGSRDDWWVASFFRFQVKLPNGVTDVRLGPNSESPTVRHDAWLTIVGLHTIEGTQRALVAVSDPARMRQGIERQQLVSMPLRVHTPDECLVITLDALMAHRDYSLEHDKDPRGPAVVSPGTFEARVWWWNSVEGDPQSSARTDRLEFARRAWTWGG